MKIKNLNLLILLILFSPILLSGTCEKKQGRLNNEADTIGEESVLPQSDPDNRWGVFSGGDITRESHPLVKGIGIRMSWKEIEPSKGDFRFNEVLGPQLENAKKIILIPI